jgi:hypothetical protein
VGEYVVGRNQVCAEPLGHHAARLVLPEERYARGDTPLAGRLGHVRRRLDPQAWDSPGHGVLEEVAVVRRDLDDEAFRPQCEPLGHDVDVAAGMVHPRVGVR